MRIKGNRAIPITLLKPRRASVLHSGQREPCEKDTRSKETQRKREICSKASREKAPGTEPREHLRQNPESTWGRIQETPGAESREHPGKNPETTQGRIQGTFKAESREYLGKNTENTWGRIQETPR